MVGKKKKPKRWRASTEARRQARLAAGTPPPERTIPNKREKAPKHKETLKGLLEKE